MWIAKPLYHEGGVTNQESTLRMPAGYYAVDMHGRIQDMSMNQNLMSTVD